MQFFTGVSSSKRLAFLFCQPFITISTMVFIQEMIEREKYEYAVEIYKYFAFYCLFLGGFVTSEIFLKTNLFKKK